jgi:hypothetical protein
MKSSPRAKPSSTTSQNQRFSEQPPAPSSLAMNLPTSQTQLREALTNFQLQCLKCAMSALRTQAELLRHPDSRMRATTAANIINTFKLFLDIDIEKLLRTAGTKERSQGERVALIVGRIMVGALHKANRFRHPLPQNLESLAQIVEQLERAGAGGEASKAIEREAESLASSTPQAQTQGKTR